MYLFIYFVCLFVCLLSLEQEKMEYEAAKHVRESMQLVENAVLERDQVTSNVFVAMPFLWG